MKPHPTNTSREKSAGIAALLESSFPGAGAMYVGQVRLGIIWLAATYISGATFVPLLFVLVLNIDGPNGAVSVVAYILCCY